MPRFRVSFERKIDATGHARRTTVTVKARDKAGAIRRAQRSVGRDWKPIDAIPSAHTPVGLI